MVGKGGKPEGFIISLATRRRQDMRRKNGRGVGLTLKNPCKRWRNDVARRLSDMLHDTSGVSGSAA